MALMIPDEVEEFSTCGEEVFYRFLRAAAKPDERFCAWYSPDLAGREPDFVLFCPEVGLIVFEVKDWSLEQICEVSPKVFKIREGVKELAKTNPHEQARGYVHNLMESIRKDGRLLSREAGTFGKVKVPISWGVVFSNINSFEYRERFSNDNIIPLDKIFFWDDLHPHSELSDPSGKAFLAALRERFEPLFPCHISSHELNYLRQIIYPTIRINPVRTGPEQELENHEENVRLLDHHQEAIARRLGAGHRIISGPSGSGKTLVLAHQAVSLQKYHPKVKRILFLCFNVSLVNYLRRLLGGEGGSLGAGGIEVLPFYEVCERIISEKVQHERQDADYYSLVLEEALSRECPEGLRYQAVLIDEGQDFSDLMLKVALKCLDRTTDILTIALDDGQDVYRQTRSWAGAGISARGRVRHLNIIYRNTKEIADFANRFRFGSTSFADAPRQNQLFPDPRISRGPCPVLKQHDSLNALLGQVASEIRALSEAGTHPLSEIAVLYTSRKAAGGEPGIPSLAADALDRQGILYKWVSEDYRSKRSCDITSNSVTISTIHSAKGLDFACVFLVGLDDLEPGERWGEEQIASLAYVGITRARFRLEITYLKTNPLIERLLLAFKLCTK